MIKPVLFIAASALLLSSCGSGSETKVTSQEEKKVEVKSMLEEEPKEADPMDNIGVGPATEVVFAEEVDMELAKKGEEVYTAKGCTACHKPDEKLLGPPPTGIYERRNPVWVMNMILNPENMTKEDPIAKKLLQEYNGVQMTNQNLTQEEARAVLEYFRTL
ncbi:MAG TPA: cytochrome C [Flavobacteriales bacterium]|jgi:cytochrome c|nr:cytochrome C [Flavobacteriales bacterium]